MSSIAQAFQRYQSLLPEKIGENALVSGGTSALGTLLIKALFSPGAPLMLQAAALAGTFALVASLVDSGIRPLLTLWSIARVGRDELFADWAFRYTIVMGAACLITTPLCAPLLGVYLSAESIQRLISYSLAINFPAQLFSARGQMERERNEARPYTILVG